MSKKGESIPWFLIVLGWIFFWPAGLILTILKIVFDLDLTSGKNSGNKIENKQHNAQNTYTRTNNGAQQNDNRYGYQNNYQTRNAAQNTYSNQSYVNQTKAHNEGAAEHKKNDGNVKANFNTQKYVPNRKNIGKSVGAILLVILGCCLLLPTVILSADAVVSLFSGVGFAAVLENFVTSGVFAAMTAGSFIGAGFFRQRNSLYMRYQTIIGDRMSVYIPKLAVKMDVKYKKAVKDLQAMIDNGYFGSKAYIDMENHQLFIDPAAEPEAVVERDAPEQVFTVTAEEDEADAGLSGSDFKTLLRQIREANKAIENVEVSEKISRIEEITRVIFSHVEENPSKKPKIHSFMDYYLPTTLKLLRAYSQLEKLDVDTENITTARENIEKILDVLVGGFEQQLDQLYESEEMDISADINVLEQMMYVDGLNPDSAMNIPKPEENDKTAPAEPESMDDILNSYSDEITDYVEGLTGGSAAMDKPEDKK